MEDTTSTPLSLGHVEPDSKSSNISSHTPSLSTSNPNPVTYEQPDNSKLTQENNSETTSQPSNPPQDSIMSESTKENENPKSEENNTNNINIVNQSNQQEPVLPISQTSQTSNTQQPQTLTQTNPSQKEEKKESNVNVNKEEVIDLEEKKRRECIANMEKIEKEFTNMREKFFTEKIQALKRDYELLMNGTHQGYLKKCEELEESKKQKGWASEKWREYQIVNIENLFESEKRLADEEYKNDKKILKEKMLNATLERKRKLLEEKNTMNLSDGNDRIVTRILRKRGMKDAKDNSTFAKKRVNPPVINYTLSQNEISDDLSLIQKVTPVYYNHHVINTNPTSTTKYGVKASEVYVDKGKLHYHSQIIEKGRDVMVESKNENGKWNGIIVVVNPAEIHIKSSDGTKSRFSLVQLRNGRYTLKLNE